MRDAIHARIEELAALWVDASPGSLQRIPGLCREIENLSQDPGFRMTDVPGLLEPVSLLAVKAERRMAGCLEVQLQAGTYSMGGSPELLPRVATSGWEG